MAQAMKTLDTMNKVPMKRFGIILFAASFLMAESCVSIDESEESGKIIQIEFMASFANQEPTKTEIHDKTSVWWSPGDAINVFCDDGSSGICYSTNNEPEATVTFRGSLNSSGDLDKVNSFWAVYPYDASNSFDGSSIIMSVPVSQIAQEDSFAPGMFPSIAKSSSMELQFFHVCGGIVFTVENEGINRITIRGNNDESLAGKISLTLDEKGNPSVKSIIAGEKTVTLTAPNNGFFIPNKQYYATILPGVLSKGYMVDYERDNDVCRYNTSTNTTINRTRFRVLEFADKKTEFVKYGNIEFVDNNLKAKLVAKFDTNNDGEISYAEASAVSSFDSVFNQDDVNYTSFDEFRFFINVKTIPKACFKNWTSLKSISLPDCLESIEAEAFYNCSSLRSITIPDNVTKFSYGILFGCEKLASINSPLVSDDGKCLISKGGNLLAFAPAGISDYTLPSSVHSIDTEALSSDTLLKLTIPESVEAIYSHAIAGNNLRRIYIKSANPPKANQNMFGYINGSVAIFVPEGSVRTYQNTENWNRYYYRIVCEVPTPDYVQIGNVRWATCNLGASKPEEFGNYYSWGEIATKDDYTINNYSYWDGNRITKYGSYEEDKLDSSDDVATVLLNGEWRMPTYSQFKTLIIYLNWKWTDNYHSTGVKGMVGYSPENKEELIFFPAAGGWTSKQHEGGNYSGCYWTANRNAGYEGRRENAARLLFKEEYAGKFNNPYYVTVLNQDSRRHNGFSIRPVYVGSTIY